MKLYFDTNMRKINSSNENMVIYYSSFLHNSIEVNYDAAKVIDYIIKNGYGNELDIPNLLEELPDFDETDIKDTYDALVESDLFFNDSVKYRSRKFLYKLYDSESDFKLERVYIHLTYRCNLKCEYCYNKEKLNSMEHLEISEWEKVLNCLCDAGKPILTITGGEAIL